jgi:enoyl-[acyl-carrier protein] reductase II
VGNSRLAAAVSKAGGLGTIGAATLFAGLLSQEIRSVRKHTQKPFAVNIPLMSPSVSELMEIIINEKVPVVITAAGDPEIYTRLIKDSGAIAMHVKYFFHKYSAKGESG